jgi:lipid-binding SYLF domain-containing protein
MAMASATALMLFTGCTTNQGASATPEARKAEINRGADTTLATVYTSVPGSRELVAKARGVLVFPSVLQAGFGIGGETGDGVLTIGGKPVDFYRTTSLSLGLQAGAQSKALVFLFMTQDALDKFRKSSGWTAGVDASVSVIKVGANGTIDTASMSGAVNAFALVNSGLFGGVAVDGTKVSKLTF